MVDRRRDPDPDRLGLRAGSQRLVDLGLELAEESVEIAAEVRSVDWWRTFCSASTTPMAIFVPPRSAPIAALTGRPQGGIAAGHGVLIADMPPADEGGRSESEGGRPPDEGGRPQRRDQPEYTVYKSRRRLGDIVRKPDLSG